MQVPDVYVRLKEFLMAHGSYLPLLQSFLNISASRCYKVYNVLWWDAKAIFWEKLHDKGVAEQLGWERALTEHIENDDVREFVGSVLVNNHKKEVKRFLKGLKTKPERVRGKLRNMRLRRRISAVFSWIFGRSKEKL